MTGDDFKVWIAYVNPIEYKVWSVVIGRIAMNLIWFNGPVCKMSPCFPNDMYKIKRIDLS